MRDDDHDTDVDDERELAVEELGRQAGAALRRPAPPGGPEAAAHTARRRRMVATGAAVVGAAALVVGGLLVLDRSDDSTPQPAVTIAPPTTETVTTSPASTSPASTSPATTSPATTSPATTTVPATIGEPAQLTVDQPGPLGLVPHPGTAPALLVLSDAGTSVTVISSYGGSEEDLGWNVEGTIRPTAADGGAVTLRTLDVFILTAIATTTDGDLVGLDAWTKTSAAIPHPGEVTDVDLVSGEPFDAPAYLVPVSFWAAGLDDGRPTLWFDSGLAAGGAGSAESGGPQNGTLSGTNTTTVVIAGTDRVDGTPLVTADSTTAYALLPESDGRSWLWLAQQPGGETRRTDLSFSAPTGMWLGEERLWVADADGLHSVELALDTLPDGATWSVPTGRQTLHPGIFHLLDQVNTGDAAVALADDGRILVFDDDGVIDELGADGQLRDGLAWQPHPGQWNADQWIVFGSRRDDDTVTINGPLPGTNW